MQLQSDGKVITLIRMRSANLCQAFSFVAEFNSHRETIAQNSGQITLVWLNIPLEKLRSVVGSVFTFISDTVATAIGLVIDVLHGLINFIMGVFTGDWGKAWDGIVGIFNGIVDSIKGTINSVIGFINGLITGVCSGINTIIRAMKKLSFDIPDWVPVFGGESFGFGWMQEITAPQIPMLANGGVITQPTLAMIGEYSGAHSNPEIAAPRKAFLQVCPYP